MKQNVPISQDRRRYYLSEFSLYDGDHFVTFNIVDINMVKNERTVAVSYPFNSLCVQLDEALPHQAFDDDGIIQNLVVERLRSPPA